MGGHALLKRSFYFVKTLIRTSATAGNAHPVRYGHFPSQKVPSPDSIGFVRREIQIFMLLSI